MLSTVKDRKWGYNGFALDSSIFKKYGGVLPGYSMQPGESLTLKVKFNPMSINSEYLAGKTRFSDSIGIKANKQNGTAGYCYFKYKSEVQATIYSPCINVEKIDFGQEIVGNSVTQSFLITNNGPSDLNITGYTLPSGGDAGIYETNLGVISAVNYLKIKAGTNKEYNVTFKPNALGQFPDKIVFKSDADTTCADYNPTLNLTGEGIELTISDIPDLNMDENTSANVLFALNIDNTNPMDFIKESDDETLIPKDNIIITRIGGNCKAVITPIQNKTGSCNLTITATNNVVSASTKFKVSVRKPGSVFDNSDISDITIIPNPANTHFSIMSKSLLLGKVEIYSVLGILVLKTENLNDIDISYLTAGIYYCLITSGNNYSTRKLVLVK
ncbi:MAG: choice-of-anchor D domain-containing protein [bacterium]